MPRTRSLLRRINEPGDKLMVLMIAGSGVLAQLISLITAIIASRMLGVEGRGQVVLVSVLAQMASQLTLGGSLPNAITKELAARGLKARDGLRGLAGRWFLWGLLGGLGGSAYLLLTERGHLSTTIWALAVGTALLAMGNMAGGILIGAMLGEGANPLRIALTGILPQAAAAVVLGIAYLADAHWNAVVIVLVILVSHVVILAARLPSLARPTGRPEDQLNRRELAALARRTHIGSIGPLDGLSLDRALVGSFLGSAALGLYSTAVALGSLSSILGVCVAMVALPKIAAAQTGTDAEERGVVRTWVLASIVLLVPTTLAFEAVTPVAIPFLFGDAFRAAIACGYWYVAASGLLSFRRVLIAILQGRGRGHLASWVEFVLTPVLVLVIYLASRTNDLETAGIGMLVVSAVACAALGVCVLRAPRVAMPAADAEEAAEEAAGEVVAGAVTEAVETRAGS